MSRTGLVIVYYKGKILLCGMVRYNTNISFRHAPEAVDSLIEGVIETSKIQDSEVWERAMELVSDTGGTEEDIIYVTYFPDLWK